MFNKEPTVIVNGLSGLLTQILPLLVVVGAVELAPEKLAGWVSVIGLVLTFISTTLLRSQVTPVATANAQIQTAIDAPKGSTTVEEVIADTAKDNEN